MTIRNILMASAAFAVMGAGANAQDGSSLPPQLQGIAGVESAGVQDGLEIFTIEGSKLIVGRAANQNDIFVGMVFDETGADVGAMILGTPPTDLDDVFEMAGVQRDTPFGDMSEEAITDNLADLKEKLGNATSQEEFVKILQEWQQTVKAPENASPVQADPEKSADEAASPDSEEQKADTEEKASADDNAPADVVHDIAKILGDMQTVSPDAAPPVQAGSDSDANSGSEGDLGLSAQTLGDGLDDTMKEAEKALTFDEQALVIYQAMSQDVSRFTAGSPDAPIIYAFLDPACVFCSRALEKMRPMVANGEIRLAAIPVPAVSSKSPDAVARVLSAENPAQALFDNARFVLSGGTDPLKPAKFEDLDPAVQRDVANNREVMVELGINQVPFFSFMTEEGPALMAGVPNDGAFDEAIVDPEQ